MSRLTADLDANSLLGTSVDLDAAAAHTIAAAMREVAACDGNHPQEMSLIDAFESEVPGSGGTVNLSTLTTPAHQEAFLKSLMMVAFADGQVSAEERALIDSYADKLAIPAAERTRAWTEVASALLSVFGGVQQWRSQVVSLGESMGLDRTTIDRIFE